MNWPKQKLLKLSLVAAALYLAGCGVKGDPLPPEKPVELGRGRPTYQRATEGIPIERVQPTRDNSKKKSEEEDEQGR